MATVKTGEFAKVTVGVSAGAGTQIVAELGTWTVSGFTREALDATAFGDDVKEYVFGVGDAGEITFSGFYHPGDTNGQVYLNSHCSNASTLVSGQIRFYVNTSSYLTVGAGGTILITKTHSISFEKSGIGSVEYSGKISGASLVCV